jgi:hypothetical protein
MLPKYDKGKQTSALLHSLRHFVRGRVFEYLDLKTGVPGGNTTSEHPVMPISTLFSQQNIAAFN